MKSLRALLRRPEADYLPIGEPEKTRARFSPWQIALATLSCLVAASAILFIVATVFLARATAAGIQQHHHHHYHHHQQQSACKNPVTRQEWRALTADEKRDFIRAIVRLAEIPSKRRANGTVYDDFAILHGTIGSWSHRSASFLPWHRYTLSIYEATLREHTGFKGHIPYWDWSLDWMDLANSSIWNSDDGFGSDGDPNGPVIVGEGRCVLDGPFARLRPILYNHTYAQHCLARGFHDGTLMGRLPGGAYKPESIGRILREPTYEGFTRQVEVSLHGSLHQSVNGDFKAMTAANDPLFYVHHAQLDRVWWRWQQMDPATRLFEYRGKHMHNSTGNATLDDHLMYGGFAEDIPVHKVMDTEGGFLCYRY